MTGWATVWPYVRRFGPALLILAAVIAAFTSGLTRHLTLHELAHRREAVEAVVHAHPWLGFLAYVGAYAAVVALSLPAALVMTLTGGLLFGPWIGGLAAAISCTVGATIVFLICRIASGDFIRQRAGPTATRIEAGVRENAFSYIVILRLLPVAPFWLINLALGLIDIPLLTFVVASFIGILPVSLIFATVGSGLNEAFARHRHVGPDLILQPKFLLPLIALSILSLGPVAYRRFGPAQKR
jgi:uncharacterized membrane protein YdjX (TVP38/TMEM64 family)